MQQKKRLKNILNLQAYKCPLTHQVTSNWIGWVTVVTHIYTCPLTDLYSKLATKVKNKEHTEGKTIPLQAWTDPLDSRRLRLPDFQTNGT
jgi:hypothetical protein